MKESGYKTVFKIAVIGSRDYTDYTSFLEILSHKLNEIQEKSNKNILHDNLMLVSGGAKGVDTMAETFAKRTSRPFALFPANWDGYGKAAGFIRNKQIVDFSDMGIAFLKNNSAGTRNTIELFKKQGKKIIVVEVQ